MLLKTWIKWVLPGLMSLAFFSSGFAMEEVVSNPEVIVEEEIFDLETPETVNKSVTDCNKEGCQDVFE